MFDGGGPSPLWVLPSWAHGLSAKRKQVKQVMKNKSIRSMACASASAQSYPALAAFSGL